MLGINGALAANLHRRFGWQLVALAGVAAVAPDWDGLTILFSTPLFNESHRVWGHNILACALVGLVIGSVDYRFDVASRCGRLMTKYLTLPGVDEIPIRTGPHSWQTLCVWILTAVAAALSQLPADMVFSGTEDLPDWELRLLWPFSDQGWVYPMVPWGDVGATLLFVAGMFALMKRPTRATSISRLTLAAVGGYIVIRGLLR